jgi:hypothetical protein
MNRLTTLNRPVALACMLVGASTSTAHAYLDPGTGSIILQVLLGGAAGLVLAGKLYWQKLVAILGLKRKSADL